jgi:transcriptional regulator with GAF, ATPase, and Fis domain
MNLELQARIARLERLLALSKRIVAEEDVVRLLEIALQSVMEFTESDRGFVMLREPDGAVRVRAARGIDRATLKSEGFRPSRSVTDRVLIGGEAVISANAELDERFQASESIHEMSVKSLLGMPIRGRDSIVGAIFLYRTGMGSTGFESSDLMLLQDFGDVTAIAVEMRRLVTTLESQSEELRKAKRTLEELTESLREDVAAKSIEISRVERDLEVKNRALRGKYAYRNIIGRSPEMHRVFDVLDQVMDYAVPVLIHGESGTGKELVARALHYGGPRAKEPFLAINCAAIPENLLESELFGYKRGAFTGATVDKEGLFRAARSGTVFLDEVGEMPLLLQSKLLRVLQEREVRPIGGREPEKIDARILAATNRDLRREQAAGRFREDLYYRLAVVDVSLPALRSRIEDIPALAEYFLEQTLSEFGLPPRRFSPEALRALAEFHWPGNVRQLENIVKSSVILARGEVLSTQDLRLPQVEVEPRRLLDAEQTPEVGTEAARARTLAPVEVPPVTIRTRGDWEALDRARILGAMVEQGWNKSRAAEALGVSRRNLYRKLARYGIEGGQER